MKRQEKEKEKEDQGVSNIQFIYLQENNIQADFWVLGIQELKHSFQINKSTNR